MPRSQAPPDREGMPGIVPEAVRLRDVRGFAWWLAEELLQGIGAPWNNATPVTSVLRVLAAMGPEPMAEDEALAEVELRGLVMHGIPPRTPEEWARAEALFSPEALREIRRWEPLLAADEGEGELLEREGGHGLQPFRLRDARAEHLQVPRVIEDEDGGGADGGDGVPRRRLGAEAGAEPFDGDEPW